MSGDPVFVAATLDIPLDHLALEARGALVPGSHDTKTIRETAFGRIPLSGHSTHSRLEHTHPQPF